MLFYYEHKGNSEIGVLRLLNLHKELLRSSKEYLRFYIYT